MPSCVLKHCKSCSQKQKKDDGVSFHRFPTDFDLRNAWIRIIRQSREDKDWTPSKFCVVCSLHFDDDDMYFTMKGRRLTKKKAKPSRNLGITREDIAGANQDKAGTSMEISFEHVPNIKKVQCSPSNGVSNVKMEESGPSQRITTVKIEESSLSVNMQDIKQEQLDPLDGINVKVEPDSTPNIVKLMSFEELPSTEPSNSIQMHEMPRSFLEQDDIRESDLDSVYDTAMENRLRKKLRKSESLCNSYRSKLRSAQQKIRRLEERKFALKTIIAKKIQRDVTSSSENRIASELFRHIYHKDSNTDIICSEEFRNFCFTLYGHSPTAYEFVRETFNNCLLDPSRFTDKGPINSYSEVCALYDYVDYVDD
ncbi:uncharacterized protein LOC121735625 [Aricia agestis]|uniref:uncharacterized protein LOC121735625 n=1 Tax=Aricia agestis TaxID=91739 RepID=UPI001C206845|nr:uncharacterized protein LOC121735625 [Aricia agestis]